MNSLERIAATLKFQDTDRVPVIAQVFGHAATLADVSLDDYVRDGETLARCQLNAWKHYGYDAVFSVMDVKRGDGGSRIGSAVPQESISCDRAICFVQR